VVAFPSSCAWKRKRREADQECAQAGGFDEWRIRCYQSCCYHLKRWCPQLEDDDGSECVGERSGVGEGLAQRAQMHVHQKGKEHEQSAQTIHGDEEGEWEWRGEEKRRQLLQHV
jgi:hypothetical protein